MKRPNRVSPSAAPAKRQDAKGQKGGHRTNSRERILESAIELFSKESIDSVKIRHLEELSGVAAPTIYHFFADKKQLHDQAVREAFNRIWKSVFANIDLTAKPEDRLRQLAYASLSTFSENNSIMRIFSNEVSQAEDDGLKAELTSKFFDPSYAVWRQTLNEIQPGSGDGLLPIFVLSALVGLGQLKAIRSLASGAPTSEPGSPEDTQEIINLLMSIVARRDPVGPS